MAKKRATSRKPVTRRPDAPQAAAPSTPSAAPRAVAMAKTATTPAKAAPVDFATEYRYVLGDLKHIGVLAAAMFATLIVLALVIR